MNVKHKKIVTVDELAQVVPREGGATWSSLWWIFYYTRMLKYVHRRHYPQIKIFFNKICTDKKLKILCDLGYFQSPQKDVYCATKKVLPILKEAGFMTDILPPIPTGKGDINELHNTDVFVEAIKLPHFYCLLYHDFGYLIPDALLVQLDTKNIQYKLTFLEIEAPKSDWHNYIESKLYKYYTLAKDIQFYNYWIKMCKHLRIKEPKPEELKFSVCVIGNIKKDLGNDFQFVHSISSIS